MMRQWLSPQRKLADNRAAMLDNGLRQAGVFLGIHAVDTVAQHCHRASPTR